MSKKLMQFKNTRNYPVPLNGMRQREPGEVRDVRDERQLAMLRNSPDIKYIKEIEEQEASSTYLDTTPSKKLSKTVRK